MKNKFLNSPILENVLFLLEIAFTTTCMIFSSRDPKSPTYGRVFTAMSFGFFAILGLVLLALCFEVIYVYENKIVSVKIFKRTEIFYNEIVSVRNAHKNFGIGSNPSYEISDSSKNKIEILSSKKRDKIVEEIKSKINLVDGV